MNHCKDSTVLDYKKFVRDVFIGYFLIHQEIIGGPSIFVQIDESVMCKRRYNVGRILRTQDQWIGGGVDSMGNVFFELTTQRNAETLELIILQHVAPVPIISTEIGEAYCIPSPQSARLRP
ncbi:LOW QUALITY PROTEIN: hypothetical protein HZS_7493 [Henneguya salminicola]|nr:LOW QUALITY PROTEIN: hypothetical protein HZS_7493 [Henneguya salminicola]